MEKLRTHTRKAAVDSLSEKRELGATGLSLFPIGFGSWAIGGTGYGKTDPQDSLAALSYAFDEGVNFYDTADTYGQGESERLIGEAFKSSSKRLQIHIATKVGWNFYNSEDRSSKNFNSEYVRFACGESLKRLKTDYIDLYQLHNPALSEIKNGRVFEILNRLKKEGKVLHWGISIHTAEEGIESVRIGAEALQGVYHLNDQRLGEELIPLCREKEIGFIVREPLDRGFLTGKYTKESRFEKPDHRAEWPREKLEAVLKRTGKFQAAASALQISLKQMAVEFVLCEPGVSVVIPGIKTKEQLKDHLAGARASRLSAEQIFELKRVFKEDPLFSGKK